MPDVRVFKKRDWVLLLWDFDLPLLLQFEVGWLVQFLPWLANLTMGCSKLRISIKGQLISKGLFAIFTWTRKRTKNFSISALEIYSTFVGSSPTQGHIFFSSICVLKCLVIYLIQINKKMYINNWKKPI